MQSFMFVKHYHYLKEVKDKLDSFFQIRKKSFNEKVHHSIILGKAKGPQQQGKTTLTKSLAVFSAQMANHKNLV